MVIDLLKNADLVSFSQGVENMALAMEFLKTVTVDTECGRYALDSSSVYVNVVEPDTVDPEKTLFEAHKRYADIHLVLRGTERMVYAPVSMLKEEGEYNEEKDCIRLSGSGSTLEVSEGMFYVVLPEDGHLPNGISTNPAVLKKAVAKVLLED